MKVTYPVIFTDVDTNILIEVPDLGILTEAMKMETPVKAPQDGTVATVDVAKGESVDSGKVLVTLN